MNMRYDDQIRTRAAELGTRRKLLSEARWIQNVSEDGDLTGRDDEVLVFALAVINYLERGHEDA